MAVDAPFYARSETKFIDGDDHEGYAAHRYGLASQLPAGHPHKDVAP